MKVPKQVINVSSSLQCYELPNRIRGCSGREYSISALYSIGGMGEAYLANGLDGRDYVIKFAKQGSEDNLLHELGVNLVAVPSDDGFAELVDWGESSERRFLVFRKVIGTTLEVYVPASLVGCLQLVRAVGEILTKLHSMAFVHGDLSPRNILVTNEGYPVVIDFGLSAASGERRLGFTRGFESSNRLLSSRSDLQSLKKILRYLVKKTVPSEQKRWKGNAKRCKLIGESGRIEGNSIGEFCRLAVGLEEILQVGRCTIASTQEHSTSSAGLEMAWKQFQEYSSYLIEYEAVAEHEPYGGPPVVTSIRQDLANAARASELLERWHFEQHVDQQGKIAIARFCRAYATHLGASGRCIEDAYYNGKAIEVYESAGFPTNLDKAEYARYLNVHGYILSGLGRHVEGAAAFLRSLAVRQELEPGESPLVAQSLNNLSVAFNRFPDTDSVCLYIEAKRLWISSFGCSNSHVAWANHNIGRVLSQCGQHHAAHDLTSLALTVKERELGDTHPQLATVWLNLARQFSRTKQYSDAFECFSIAERMRTNCHGYDSYPTLVVVNEWAKALFRSGQPRDAFGLLKSRYCQNILRTSNLEVAELLELLALLAYKLRLKAEARRFSFEYQAYISVLPKNPQSHGAHHEAFQLASKHLGWQNLRRLYNYIAGQVERDMVLLNCKYRIAPEELLL